MRCDHIVKGVDRLRMTDAADDSERHEGRSDSLCSDRPSRDTVHVGGCIAATLTVLTTMFMVVAAHGFAARHGLVGGGHGQTIEAIGSKTDRKCPQEGEPGTPHAAKTRDS